MQLVLTVSTLSFSFSLRLHLPLHVVAFWVVDWASTQSLHPFPSSWQHVYPEHEQAPHSSNIVVARSSIETAPRAAWLCE